MPVLLLNKERVGAEIMELARIKIATMLRVPIEMVGARWEHEKGKSPTPAFDIDMDKATGALAAAKLPPLSEDEVRQAMGAVWRWLRDSLNERLEGLGDRRGQR